MKVLSQQQYCSSQVCEQSTHTLSTMDQNQSYLLFSFSGPVFFRATFPSSPVVVSELCLWSSQN